MEKTNRVRSFPLSVFATHPPRGVVQSFKLCRMLRCSRFVFALVRPVVPICCRAGLRGLRGTKVTADGSTLPPSSRPRETGWAAASLSLVVVAKLEKAWQDSQVDWWNYCHAISAQEKCRFHPGRHDL